MLATTKEANDYRKEFHSYYYENIISKLNVFEESRKQTLIYCRLIQALAVFVGIAGFACWLYLVNTYPVMLNRKNSPDELLIQVTAGLIFLLLWWAYKISKNFEKKVKQGVIENFLAFFGDFKWFSNQSISVQEANESKLFYLSDTVVGDDYFEGCHRGVKIKISEVSMTKGNGKNKRINFEGVCVLLDFNKNCFKHTIVVEDNKLLRLFEKPSGLEPVELEDPEFNKIFDVYSQDQVESRYILTTSFMERFKNLKNVYKSKSVKASFKNNSILLAIPCNKDMFKLGELTKPITDSGQIQTLFEEFVAVLSIVDLLKLDSKLGL